jgi:hypothetical protein
MTTDERVDDRDPGGDADAGVNDKADASDVVEGPIGGASLREPSEIEADGAGADLASLPEIDDEAGSQANQS